MWGGPGVAEALKERLEAKFPGLKIVGTYTPPFRPLNAGEEKELQARVSALKPDIIWVGLSTPKQEKFMAQYLPKLDTTLMFGVGAAFDFHAGRVRQAPRWMQRSGLEWLFRLGCEPRRLWKRYLKNNPLFVLPRLSAINRVEEIPVGRVGRSRQTASPRIARGPSAGRCGKRAHSPPLPSSPPASAAANRIFQEPSLQTHLCFSNRSWLIRESFNRVRCYV